ncbi:MAG: hypothetical protein ABSH22_17730, partial [Tepidisphaeraceae bacterium]
NLPEVSDTGFPATGQLKSLYPGDLVFYIRWDTNTHVEIALSAFGNNSQGGEYIQPVRGLNSSPSGGYTPFDNLGGPTGGYELIIYPTTSFPNNARYDVAALNLGSVATTVTFDAFVTGSELAGKPVNGLIRQYFLNTTNPALPPSKEVVQTVQPGFAGGAIAVVKANSRSNSFFGGGGTQFRGGFSPTVASPGKR